MRSKIKLTGHLKNGVPGLFVLHPPELLSGASTEREIIMLKFLQNSGINDLRLPGLFFASVALIAVMSAAPVAPALAQGVPAGLLRLDPPQPSNDTTKLSEDQRAKVRSAYARSRKHQAQ